MASSCMRKLLRNVNFNLVFSLLIFPSLMISLGAANFDEVKIITRPVSTNIFMLEGAGGNIAISVGEDGIFMIDAQFAPLAELIEASMQKIHAGQIGRAHV